ncbi:hypothetical protein GQ42DRAFT_162749 [Ramicandelaber brevisporus]|nr:hypothetical protein GQ42DRAFT_162749 [Ramicandelaber brevisporus]
MKTISFAVVALALLTTIASAAPSCRTLCYRDYLDCTKSTSQPICEAELLRCYDSCERS